MCVGRERQACLKLYIYIYILLKHGDCSLEMPEHQGNINIELNPLPETNRFKLEMF